MKNIALFIALTMFASISYAQDFWYTITFQTGTGTYDYHGTSDLNESDLIKKIQTDSFVLVKNLVYFDNQQKAKSWSEWAPQQKPQIYLKSSNILAIHPLTGDPRSAK